MTAIQDTVSHFFYWLRSTILTAVCVKRGLSHTAVTLWRIMFFLLACVHLYDAQHHPDHLATSKVVMFLDRHVVGDTKESGLKRC